CTFNASTVIDQAKRDFLLEESYVEVLMCFTVVKLQYWVRIDNPDVGFASVLKRAIGGVEGEIRATLMHYFFQGWTQRDLKHRDTLLLDRYGRSHAYRVVGNRSGVESRTCAYLLQDEAGAQ